MDDKLTIYIAVLTGCLVLQTIVILAAAIALLKLRARMEAMAEHLDEAKSTFQTRVLPVLDDAKAMQQDIKEFLAVTRPKVETLLDNASRISTTARASAERIETTLNDAIDRVRLQVIRGDEMVTRTMDRIEETSEKVQHTVMSPVRQVSGIVQAISIGFGSYFHQQRRRRNGGPSDEMFI
jgi:methyl-accepting chemotaxis protein